MSRSASVSRGLEQRLLRKMARLDLHPPSRLGVAFSGGVDSLALAVASARVALSAGIEPRLFHIDHQLRPSSSFDADLCGGLAAALGLPIDVAVIDPEHMNQHLGVGIEEAARRERYLLLADLAATYNVPVIALAHHADDQAETVLLHLLRGAGVRGAAGMRELQRITIPWWAAVSFQRTRQITVWRPFLQERKSALEEYVVDARVDPVIDESNTDPRFLRNRVRHELLPLMEQIRPGAVNALGRYASISEHEDDFLEEAAGHAYNRVRTDVGNLSIARLVEEPDALQRRALYRWLIDQGVEEPTMERVQAILEKMTDLSSAQIIEAGSNICVTVHNQELVAFRASRQDRR
jgi:tRNA(Ile)-lysidine synthase